MSTEEPAPPVPARPAASLLLLRERPAGGVEVHMQRRRAEMDFGGLAYVFPGGSVDAADAEPGLVELLDEAALREAAGRMRLDPGEAGMRECAAFHVCAIRECFEEAGVLLAGDGDPGPEALAEARHRLLAGGSFAEVLGALGLRPRAETLVYIAHFITPVEAPRRYDTRFFAAAAPAGQAAAWHAGEATAGGWWTPAEMTGMADRGEALLMPPTRILLNELGRHAGVAAALGSLGERDVARILFSFRRFAGPLPDHLPGVEEIAALEAQVG